MKSQWNRSENFLPEMSVSVHSLAQERWGTKGSATSLVKRAKPQNG